MREVAEVNGTLKRLLAVSARLFRAKGFGAATTRELANLTGIQNASLYYHIKSKQDLLYLLSKDSLDHITSEVEAAVSGVDDAAERVRRLIFAHVTTMLADRDQHATMLIELRSLRGRNRNDITRRRDRYEELVRSVIQQCQSDSILRSDISARHLTLVLLNVMNWSIFWFDPGGELKPRQWARVLYAVFMNGANALPVTNSVPDKYSAKTTTQMSKVVTGT